LDYHVFHAITVPLVHGDDNGRERRGEQAERSRGGHGTIDEFRPGTTDLSRQRLTFDLIR